MVNRPKKAPIMEAIVKFDNVGLRYDRGPEVLSDIHFSLLPGHFYFLTGPSGAGKTSLLKLLYLDHRPSRGVIHLFGQDAVTLPRARLPGFRRRIGVVFQNFRLVDHLNVFDNIALPLRIAGVEDKYVNRATSEIIKWVGLDHRKDVLPATLSGGEQQRVAIARAVVGKPDILVADEPTGNVDPELAVKLMQLFSALQKMGTTIIVATHDIQLFDYVPKRQILYLKNGGLIDPTGALKYPPKEDNIRADTLELSKIYDKKGGKKGGSGL